jgi:hypothetical protein
MPFSSNSVYSFCSSFVCPLIFCPGYVRRSHWMGNSSSSSPPLSSRLSVGDESPLLTHDRVTLGRYFKGTAHLINILPTPIIDIIIDYYKPLQQRILSFGMSSSYSVHSIGWLSSELPPRNGTLRTLNMTTQPHNNDSKKIITDDVDGYRLIYGKCPLEYIRHIAIINDSLYVFGSHKVGFASCSIISCSMNDIYSSSLSLTIPSSVDDVKSLIRWRTYHCPPNIDTFMMSRTCVWRGRWCFIGHQYCCYYDTFGDQWYQLPLPPMDDLFPSVHYDHMYVASATELYIYIGQFDDQRSSDIKPNTPLTVPSSPTSLINNNNGRWQQVENMNGRHGTHLISPSLPSSLQSSSDNKRFDDGRFGDDIIFVQGAFYPPPHQHPNLRNRQRHMHAVPYIEQHSHNNGLTLATEWLAIRDMKKKKKPSWITIWSDCKQIIVIDHQWLLFLPTFTGVRQEHQRPSLCRWNDINQIQHYRWYPTRMLGFVMFMFNKVSTFYYYDFFSVFCFRSLIINCCLNKPIFAWLL